MDNTDLVPLIEVLDDNVDDLEEALEPLLSNTLVKNAGTLPLMDKAQLYVLFTYAIESILFSYLRLNGVNAKEHPVFRELTRVKQYFEKIKTADSANDTAAPATQLDKGAAGRFIRHALSGNDKHDQMVAKQLEERKAALEEKLASHARRKSHEQASAEQVEERKLIARTKAQSMALKRKRESESDAASDSNDSSSGSDSSDSDSSGEEPEVNSASIDNKAPGAINSKSLKKQPTQTTKPQRKLNKINGR